MKGRAAHTSHFKTKAEMTKLVEENMLKTEVIGFLD
jgi:hypothetical protein